ncbi:MAG TPA: Stk1 family PASTA domain-containing Ser/Thr kinase [Gaiellaceae bacterium]|nr:Stk1 family PASTA domain-containing Ser/Thr kinase [Gaiellaceae bacterium]
MTTSEEIAGTLFAGRYRLERKLGSGGMADVWLAGDQELGRRVAVKILHGRYASDAQFVERFRREATHAAGLSHPNIVSIFDRGEVDGSYFIVMEYVEGRTLKELLVSRGPCPVPVAISYTRQILAALRYAHRNGIIHRDIKPHNVIVDREGRVKVTDFGIARAGTSQMTEAGSIIGTAQYLSPEQARGAPVEESSDLYSSGIVLYELLTGKVPFSGETAVEIAMKHLSQAPEAPSTLRPEIPRDLDLVVLRALAKEPTDRYRSASEMDRDLELVARGEQVGRETAEAATVVLAGGGAVAETTAATQVRRTQAYGGEERYRAYEAPVARGRAWWPWLLALGALLALAVAGYFVWDYVQNRLEESEPVAVGEYEGLREANAVALVGNADLKPRVKRLPNDEVPEGIVADQSPEPGTRLAKGSIVELTVSSGKRVVKVPDVRGKSLADAIEELSAADLDADPRDVNSDEPPGTVTAQDPAPNEEVVAGTSVRINVSQGPKEVAVPSVTGLLEDAATSQLQAAGFAVARRDVPSDLDRGTVVTQDPPGNSTAVKGSTVTLSVSTGPLLETVPDVTNLDVGTARTTLLAAGFRVSAVRQDTDDPTLDGVVVDQQPFGNEQAEPGSRVVLTVGRYVEPPPATLPQPTPPPPTPPPTDTTGDSLLP